MILTSPNSLPEFHAMFPDERACEDYLFALRWPDGFACPECGGSKLYWHRERRLVDCAYPPCAAQTYLTAGTMMHRSHMPLLTWFHAAYLATTFTPGISAVQFQRQLGLSRYETAFQMLHKLRAAMVNPDREPLKGVVEVDETYVGGAEPGAKGGRSTEQKTLVVGAVEQRHSKERKRRGGRYAGRVRFRVIEDAGKKSLTEFVEAHVEKGATVLTDGWDGYNALQSKGYDHQPTVEGHRQNAAHILPLIHLEFSNIKTWLQGTHHGRQERQHLQAYLNEFAFRHNRRFWKFTAFQRVLQIGMQIAPQEYRRLYGADEYGRDVHAA